MIYDMACGMIYDMIYNMIYDMIYDMVYDVIYDMILIRYDMIYAVNRNIRITMDIRMNATMKQK